MHVIINHGLHDADYIARYTVGFDRLREKVQEYSPERVENWTGIAASDIVRLAREYATTRPAVIRLNYGVQRSEGGGMATRAITMLPCITGSWKEIGGGLQLSTSGAYGLNRDALERTDLMNQALGRPARTINMVELGRALNTLKDPPVKALFVYNSNPAAVCPNHNDVVRGLRRSDLFTVVHEQFFTDTTDYADIVLPATTFFEHKDLQTAYGHYFLQMSDPAIAPLGECRSNVEVFGALAKRMGFADECFDESVDQMIDAALNSGNPLLRGIDRDRLQRKGHVRLGFENQTPSDDSGVSAFFLPFAKGNFPTLSGKAELYSEQLKSQGLDPVAAFTPPSESRHGSQAKAFPLELLARKADNFLNTSFANLPAVQNMEEVGLLEMNSADARSRGIADGDAVRVFNRRGDIRLRARVDGAVQAGVVSAKLHWAKLSSGNRNINVLTSEKLTDLGNSATFYSVLVEVELSKSAP
ncbi:MAG TPA: molybdopterin dinucleotide binding domain-containing protein, partial [Terriglobales bacterium]|nr:molybdopterin dinucleotide binding domain-containing protein [Terriglobales bacterium]